MTFLKFIFIALWFVAYSCNQPMSSNDNSHLRNGQSPHSNNAVKPAMPDSIGINGRYYYQLKRDLMVNGRFVSDTFTLEACRQSIGEPDSIQRGGPSIVEEFGAGDYDLYYGKSVIYAGHGQILEMHIKDRNLKLYTIGIGDNRVYMEKILNLRLPRRDTLSFIYGDGGVYLFALKKDVISDIAYYAPPL